MSQLPSVSSEWTHDAARAGEASLDPGDWDGFAALCHQMLDESLRHLRTVRERPVWQPVPDAVKEAIREPLPLEPQGAEQAGADYRANILPYITGNIHPRFLGYVHGTGTPGGMLAEMLAAAINCNLGGREHAPMYVEQTVIEWARQLFDFPETASGLLVSGTSMATLLGLTVARQHLAGGDVKNAGVAALPRPLTAYASAETHNSAAKALEMLGLGRNQLRQIPVNERFEMDVAALREAIRRDREAGLKPFCVIGTAGTVNSGAVDDLDAIADVCQAERLWFHVDGAFGALIALHEELKPRLKGIERADSLAFDFHKWMHVPYDAGCLLVRDRELHRAAFASRPAYLTTGQRGLGAGDVWFCDYGPELSRGFRALKVWWTLKEHGARRLGEKIAENCAQARCLGELAESRDCLELLAPVSLNIACFRYRAAGLSEAELDRLNDEIVILLQERGIAAPSTTRIRGRLAIRVCIANHRTRLEDMDLVARAVEEIGQELAASLVSQQEALTAPAETLLISGGDDRLAPHPVSGRNKYGCPLRPDPQVISFASSTASIISPEAFAQVEELQRELHQASLAGRLGEAHRQRMQAVRDELKQFAGAAGAEAILSPSGTDTELYAVGLLLATSTRPLCNLIVAAEESGSGVIYAGAGQHYSSQTPSGKRVKPGTQVSGFDPARIEVRHISARDAQGRLFPREELDGEIQRQVAAALLRGRHCLAHLLDCSKTGWRGPGLQRLIELKRRWPETLDVVVDACQLRCSAEDIRRYLEAGFLVQITGSKFYTGPAFSGALLLPAEWAARLQRRRRLPEGLADYADRSEWPDGFPELPERPNFGLLARWTAALHHLREYQEIPAEQSREILHLLQKAARQKLAVSPAAQLLPGYAPEPGSQAVSTIIPFLLRWRNGRPLSVEHTKTVYQKLSERLQLPREATPEEREAGYRPIHLGQPVTLSGTEEPRAALRLCLSARDVAQVARDATLLPRLEHPLQNIERVIEKIELILRYWPHFRPGDPSPDAAAEPRADRAE